MEQTINVQITKSQMQATVQLLDLAVKSGGLQVAHAALDIVAALEQAMQSQSPVATEQKEAE